MLHSRTLPMIWMQKKRLERMQSKDYVTIWMVKYQTAKRCRKSIMVHGCIRMTISLV